MSDRSDATIIELSLGEPPVFADLYERHLAVVLGFISRRVGGQVAEDLTAEVFVRAFRGRDGYRAQHASALPWLLRIATHLTADNRRAERRRLTLLQQLAGRTETSAEDHDPSLSAELVGRLRRLPTADRDTLLLVVWGELTYEEAAIALNVPVGTVRSPIARARTRLQEAIGRAIDSPPASCEPRWTTGEPNV